MTDYTPRETDFPSTGRRPPPTRAEYPIRQRMLSRLKDGLVTQDNGRSTLVYWGKILRVLCVDGIEYTREGKPVRLGLRFLPKYLVA
jgi:hypothetical protein